VEIYGRVRRAVLVDGKSQRAVAREFGLSRDTVPAALAQRDSIMSLANRPPEPRNSFSMELGSYCKIPYPESVPSAVNEIGAPVAYAKPYSAEIPWTCV
jgi:hypothetical protein